MNTNNDRDNQQSFHPNSIDATLARIEARQEANAEKLNTFLEQVSKQDARISALERSKYWLTGFAASAGAVIGFVAIGIRDWIVGHGGKH